MAVILETRAAARLGVEDTSARSARTRSASSANARSLAKNSRVAIARVQIAELILGQGQVWIDFYSLFERGSFASDDYSLKSFELDAGDINTSGDTVLTLRSKAASAADRPNWSPSGPDFSSTYREGFVLGTTLQLIVEVELEYHA